MLPRKGVLESYVVVDPETKKVTDFFSFYSLPSSCLRHAEHKTLWVAYMFYYAPGAHTTLDLIKDALAIAK